MALTLKHAVVRPVAMLVLAIQAFMFQGALLLAQDGGTKKVDVNVDVDNPAAGGGAVWYGNWWVWAIGIAVFLIIIVALTNRGRGDGD